MEVNMEDNLIAKVRGNVDVLKELVDNGVQAQMAYNAVLVQLKNGIIPDILEKYKYQVKFNVSESCNSQQSTIICGLNGEKLKPYYIPKKATKDGQAFFCLWACVKVIYNKPHDNVRIIRLSIIKKDNKATIKKETLYNGSTKYISMELYKFADAISAAIEKLNGHEDVPVYYES